MLESYSQTEDQYTGSPMVMLIAATSECDAFNQYKALIPVPLEAKIRAVLQGQVFVAEGRAI